MCSPVLNLPSNKEPPECYPCCLVAGPKCLPCGMDPVTLRRPLIVHDSTFDYRPTSWPGMLLNNQDKKVRYQLINYERPKNCEMCDRMNVINRLQSVMSAIRGDCCPGGCCRRPCCAPCCGAGGGGSLVTVYNAVLAIGQPPRPVAAFDKAVIEVGCRGRCCPR